MRQRFDINFTEAEITKLKELSANLNISVPKIILAATIYYMDLIEEYEIKAEELK
ncbi:MAG: hypothetical protein ACRCX2_13915 [Paraclostridium sp.]